LLRLWWGGVLQGIFLDNLLQENPLQCLDALLDCCLTDLS
jgi:hypothetical protein